MDDAMMPKIADFGLSRLLGAQKTRTIVNENLGGTLGYMAPEYIVQGVASSKADIFSFGVIMIEIITGRKEYPLCTIPYNQKLNENGGSKSTENALQQYTENVS
ncbi:hypothetical protein PR202_ga03659 [Eleusine coracana subsp. coracana]|uniref:Protein kinase domain-containing protein n=1 Tax=Eleusine coracana subsp. coracana TaxID=191504 RepID=A0AAV5BN79_ELECO|nr:hypothetical protein PR202_ga03659 [Eleusine coracana subsp. coracana]